MKDIINKIEQEKIITIVRGVAEDKILPLAKAMYDGGIRLIECTFDASGTVSNEETASYIEIIVKHFGSEMIVGGGTVLNEEQVGLTKKAGGKFIISPDTNPDVIRKTKELGLISIPGALTPTEIADAHRYGADFVKMFPVNAMGGTNYIKAISAPLSNIKFLAVGGVNKDNISDFLKAGFSGAGIGNGIVNSRMVENEDYEGITRLAAEFVKNARNA